MTVKHLKDGEDFSASHFAETGFGFTGSAKGHEAAPPYAADRDTRGPKSKPEPTEAGEGGGDYARGGSTMHPHGHRIVDVVHEEDGRVVMHHAHGGHSVMHPTGMMTHHNHNGTPAASMGSMGVEAMHDESEYAHNGVAPAGPTKGSKHTAEPEEHGGGDYAKGGRSDSSQDKAMVKKGIRQHENHEHGGEHTDLHLAGGGFMHARPRIGKAMRPKAESMHSPINTTARNPNRMTSPRNLMPGGEMNYGVEPSAEPDTAGSDQTGIPQLRRGGRKE